MEMPEELDPIIEEESKDYRRYKNLDPSTQEIGESSKKHRAKSHARASQKK